MKEETRVSLSLNIWEINAILVQSPKHYSNIQIIQNLAFLSGYHKILKIGNMLHHDTILENIKDKCIFAYVISILIDFY